MKFFNIHLTLEHLYIIFANLSFVMYIFGHSTEWGNLPFPDKLFYIPCAITLLIGILNSNYRRLYNTDYIFIFFWVLAFVNTSLSVGISIETMFNSLLGYLIFRYLSNVDFKLTIMCLFYLTPLVIIIHYLFSNPFGLSVGYRYGGFQGDPNCFSFAMNILLYVCSYVLNFNKNVLFKCVSIVCVLLIFPLLLAAASRGNIAIAVLISLYSIKEALWRNKVLLSVFIIFALIYGSQYVARFNTQFETVTNRYSETEGGKEYRTEELSIVPAVLLAHPIYLPLGIGYNESLKANERFPNEYYHEGRCHNSYMSILLEEGLIGFILFMIFLYKKARTVWLMRDYLAGKLNIIMMFNLLFFFYTIYCLPFLPFWYILNLITNRRKFN